jgi:hypothetical protein
MEELNSIKIYVLPKNVIIFRSFLNLMLNFKYGLWNMCTKKPA